jgi:hypothetical protein
MYGVKSKSGLRNLKDKDKPKESAVAALIIPPIVYDKLLDGVHANNSCDELEVTYKSTLTKKKLLAHRQRQSCRRLSRRIVPQGTVTNHMACQSRPLNE